MKTLLIFLFIIGFIAIAVIFFAKKDSSTKKEEKLPFKKKEYFFSRAEKKFYLVLKQVADKNNLVVFLYVCLLDLFLIQGRDYKFRTINRNKVIRKHIDFLLCDSNTFSPVIGVELDDSSHNRSKTIQRDDFVNKVFASAELPLLRIKASFNYSVDSLEKNILEKINPKKTEDK